MVQGEPWYRGNHDTGGTVVQGNHGTGVTMIQGEPWYRGTMVQGEPWYRGNLRPEAEHRESGTSETVPVHCCSEAGV